VEAVLQSIGNMNKSRAEKIANNLKRGGITSSDKKAGTSLSEDKNIRE